MYLILGLKYTAWAACGTLGNIENEHTLFFSLFLKEKENRYSFIEFLFMTSFLIMQSAIKLTERKRGKKTLKIRLQLRYLVRGKRFRHNQKISRFRISYPSRKNI